MKWTHVLLILSLAMSAFAIQLAAKSDSPIVGSGDSEGPRLQDNIRDELLTRLDEIGEAQLALGERLARLELEPAPSERAPIEQAVVSREEFDALQSEVRGGSPGTNPASGAPGGDTETALPTQQLSELVADSLNEIRGQEADQRRSARHQARIDNIENKTLPGLNESLGLEAWQSDAMRTALLTRAESGIALEQLWEETGDYALMGEEKGNIQEQFVQDITVFLTVGQLDTYNEQVQATGK